MTAVQVGDIFRSSWGYDQTNVDFYEVMDVSATGKTVKVRQVQSRLVEDKGSGHESVAPIPGSTHPWEREIMTKRVQVAHDGRPMIRIESYALAYLWDGNPAYQTASGWGH